MLFLFLSIQVTGLQEGPDKLYYIPFLYSNFAAMLSKVRSFLPIGRALDRTIYRP